MGRGGINGSDSHSSGKEYKRDELLYDAGGR